LVLVNISYKLCIIVLLIFSIGMLQILFKEADKDLYKYMIKDFNVNRSFILIYIGIYILLFFYLRVINLLGSIDLKILFKAIQKAYLTLFIVDFILIGIICLLLLIIVIQILSKFHYKLIKEITKQFLFLCYTNDYLLETLKKYTLLCITKKIQYKCSISQFVNNRFIYKAFCYIEIYLFNFIFVTLPSMLLPLIFFLELYFNDFVLKYIFSYLLFYFCYSLYKRFSLFLEYTLNFLNQMLCDMYYRNCSIVYVNMGSDIEDLIYRYIKRGLIHNEKKEYEPLLDDNIGSLQFKILCEHKFISKDLGATYYNNNNDYFEEPDNKRVDLLVLNDLKSINNLKNDNK